ncbi:MAG: hypothetical protein ACI9OJ_004152, partial [Myxococcota bacterium]
HLGAVMSINREGSMRRHASRVGLLGLLTLSAWGCTEAASTPDVMSELPGEIRYRTFVEAAETPAILITSPPSATTFTLSDPGGCVDVDVTFTTNCDAEILDGTYELAVYVNGDLVAPPASTVGTTSVCLDYGQRLVTLQIVKADDSALETAASRDAIELKITKQCDHQGSGDADCQDDYFCTPNQCNPDNNGVGFCSFGAKQAANCCSSNQECSFGDFCDTVAHQCVQCLSANDCIDGNDCTIDDCESGSCTNVKTDPECCDCSVADEPGQSISAQCADILDCTVEGCDCGTSTCTHLPVVQPQGACCEDGAHASCNDGDACTDDLCVTHVCRHYPPQVTLPDVPQCCNVDGDCNDGNVCTTDICDENTNLCLSSAVNDPLCCNVSSECDDGLPNTLDACIAFQCISTVDLTYCFEPKGVKINELMVNPADTNDTAGEWIELYNYTDVAVDVDGWILTDDLQSLQTHVIDNGGPLEIPALGYLVLCRLGDSNLNGGVDCDYEYGNGYAMSNNSDEVVLQNDLGVEVGRVEYDGGLNFPDTNGAGASIGLNYWGVEDINLGPNWSSATNTYGTSDKGTPGAQNIPFVRREHLNCDDGKVCTTNACNYGDTCANPAKADCCESAADCQLPSQCHVATCTGTTGVQGTCQYTVLDPPDCCTSDAQCADTLVCNFDKCVANICRHGPSITASDTCCDVDADCGDVNNNCLVASCDTGTNECNASLTTTDPLCCGTNTFPAPAQSGDCPDDDASIVYTCQGHQCIPSNDPTYCDGVINNCAGDNDPCTGIACDIGNKTCLYDAIPECCHVATDCNDGDPCTEDICPPNQVCFYKSKGTGCCVKSNETIDCNDGNACTEDTCIGTVDDGAGVLIGSCRSVSTPNCCVTPTDCNDKNACTLDQCEPVGDGTSACTFPPVIPPPGEICCDSNLPINMNTQCDDDDQCTFHQCGADNLCINLEQPDNVFGKCCDSSQDQAVECDDTNNCTDDLCITGRCRNLDAGSASCCTGADDCPPDGNSCTTAVCEDDDGTGVCKYNPPGPGEVCLTQLPFTECMENFNNVTGSFAEKLNNYGWEVFQCPAATNSAASNWRVDNTGSLGPDDYMKFRFTPPVTDFHSCFLSPKIDSFNTGLNGISKPADYMTMQFEAAWNVTAADIKMTVFAFEADESDALPLSCQVADVEGAGWEVLPEYRDLLLPATMQTGDLVTWNLSGTAHYESPSTRYAFCFAGTDSTKMVDVCVDCVKVNFGLAPEFGVDCTEFKAAKPGQFCQDFPAPPEEITAVCGKSREVLISTTEKDLQTDPFVKYLNYSFIEAPAHVGWKGAAEFEFTGPGSFHRVMGIDCTDPALVGDHTIQLRIDDGFFEARRTIILHQLLGSGYVVWQPEDVTSESGEQLEAGIKAYNRPAHLISNLGLYTADQLAALDGIFIVLGNRNANHVLTAAEAAKLQAAVNAGAKVYLEGGETWGDDATTAFHSL